MGLINNKLLKKIKMENTTFEKAKALKDRIAQLIFIREYLRKMFEGKPFSLKLEFTLMEQEYTNPLVDINPRHEALNLSSTDKDDFDFILEAVDRRIAKLEREFQMLQS
jgi:hypothetical protein